MKKSEIKGPGQGPYQDPVVTVGERVLTEGEKIALWCALNDFHYRCKHEAQFREDIGRPQLLDNYAARIEDVMLTWQQSAVRGPAGD